MSMTLDIFKNSWIADGRGIGTGIIRICITIPQAGGYSYTQYQEQEQHS